MDRRRFLAAGLAAVATPLLLTTDPARAGVRQKVPAPTASLVTRWDVDRWWQCYSATGYGLRGGEYSYAGDARVRFTLTGVKLVRDLPVSGTVTWHRDSGAVKVELKLPAASGVRTVTGSWNAKATGAMATLRVTGALGPATLTFPAP